MTMPGKSAFTVLAAVVVLSENSFVGKNIKCKLS